MKPLFCMGVVCIPTTVGIVTDCLKGYLYTLPWVLCSISVLFITFICYITYKEEKIQDELEHQKIKEKFLNKGDIDGK